MVKKLFFLCVVLIFTIHVFAEKKKVTKQGVQYVVLPSGIAGARLTNHGPKDIVISERIKIGKKVYIVEEIGNGYYRGKNKHVKSVTLPNTIKKIKRGAFRNCTKLKKIVLPVSFYKIEYDAFMNCNNLSDVQGNLAPFKEDNIYLKLPSASTPPFSSYLDYNRKSRMEIWQSKKDYETIEQYKTRMANDNREKRMEQFKEEMKIEYIWFYAPRYVSCKLNNYDIESEVFTLQTNSFGNVYAKVPKADEKRFRENFNIVDVIPQFGVSDDTLTIMSCRFKLWDQIYDCATDYTRVQSDKNEPKMEFASVNDLIDIDQDIPRTAANNKNTFALIIGNENYTRVDAVPYAENDAIIFAEYCKKTLGIPDNQVLVYLNATLNDMKFGVDRLLLLLSRNKGARIIVYYAGHGIPDKKGLTSFLLPVDGYSSNTGYRLKELYDKLDGISSEFTTVFLDACFCGMTREGKIFMGGRGAALAVNDEVPTGNVLAFSASTGMESAYSDNEHKHGRFTYFLLKHLHDTKGKTTLRELTEYVKTQVENASDVGKKQEPKVIPSIGLGETWKDIKLR